MTGIFTVDVEDWYDPLDGAALETQPECRAHIGTERLLDLLDRHSTRATFFVLGTVADRQPWLVEMIAARGHEIGSHGHHHERLHGLGARAFRDDLLRSIDTLQRAGAPTVRSYRAPYFSLDAETQWAVPALAEAGIRVDSSVFPMRTGRYGVRASSVPRIVEALRGSGIVELPISLPHVGPFSVPLAGGFYCRLFPPTWTLAALQHVAARGTPVFYIHPWELDPSQPRVALRHFAAFRHYLRLRATANVVDRVLGSMPWMSAGEFAARRAFEPGATVSGRH